MPRSFLPQDAGQPHAVTDAPATAAALPPLLQPSAPLSAACTPFDTALLTLSDCLADAALLCERGDQRRARGLYAAAARYAGATGFLELLHLVWAHEEQWMKSIVPS